MRPILIAGVLCCALSLGQTWLPAQAATQQPKLNIAMVLWQGITETEQGFQDQLKALGYDVNYDLFNAQQNKQALVTYLRGPFDQNIQNYHYVYSFGTTVSTSVFVINQRRIPHIYNSVTNPQESGLTHQTNTAGGSINIPTAQLMTQAQKIKPFKTLGFFFNARELNAMQIFTELVTISKTLDFKIIEYRSPPAHDTIEKNIALLKTDSKAPEAIYIPSDSYIISNRDIIIEACIQRELFTISSHRKVAQSGAVFTLAPDPYYLGRKVAGIVAQHQKGKALIDIPVQYDDQPKILINQRGLKASGLQLPKDVAKKAEYLP